MSMSLLFSDALRKAILVGFLEVVPEVAMFPDLEVGVMSPDSGVMSPDSQVEAMSLNYSEAARFGVPVFLGSLLPKSSLR